MPPGLVDWCRLAGTAHQYEVQREGRSMPSNTRLSTPREIVGSKSPVKFGVRRAEAHQEDHDLLAFLVQLP
jgi:hypothetical protein